MNLRFAAPALIAFASAVAPSLAVTGSLSTPAGSGLISGGGWAAGYMVSWDITPNGDGTWHYEYTLSNAAGGALSPASSHAIFQLSENIEESDLLNFGGNFDEAEFGTFGPSAGNPGFPTGESIYGVKIDFSGGGVTFIEFDSTRQPMWGDFYAKGGATSFVYNTDLGVPVANANDYWATPVDANNNPLFKILVPDTIPAPGSIALVALGGLMISRRRRS
ncbi:MAG: PEP-CTERM sorting domain-containing protein [Phycisphaeraceae bacterium]|nr:PEP-CTERM sorting domain-containing protein [Phycisphaeraceae bacterium]